MSTVLAAIITLIGTLTVVAIGYWQWRRTQSTSQNRDYREKRIEALKVLWDALNKIEENQRAQFKKVKRGMISDARIREVQQEQTREMNLLIMRSAPFLLDDEREWSTSIVQSIIEIDTVLRLQKNLRGEWWGQTAPRPATETEAARAAERLNIARDALASRYAAVMRGTHR